MRHFLQQCTAPVVLCAACVVSCDDNPSANTVASSVISEAARQVGSASMDGIAPEVAQGSSISAIGTRPTNSTHNQDIAARDVDGDGDIDIIIANQGDHSNDANPTQTVLLNDGSGAFTKAPDSINQAAKRTLPPSLPADAHDVKFVDMNGDGALDIVFMTGDNNIGVMLAKP